MACQFASFPNPPKLKLAGCLPGNVICPSSNHACLDDTERDALVAIAQQPRFNMACCMGAKQAALPDEGHDRFTAPQDSKQGASHVCVPAAQQRQLRPAAQWLMALG